MVDLDNIDSVSSHTASVSNLKLKTFLQSLALNYTKEKSNVFHSVAIGRIHFRSRPVGAWRANLFSAGLGRTLSASRSRLNGHVTKGVAQGNTAQLIVIALAQPEAKNDFDFARRQP